jgi:hypothetical protein
MHRVLYVFLPNWPIDRLRRNGLLPTTKPSVRSDSSDSAPTKPSVPAPSRPLRGSPSPVDTGEGWGGGRHRGLI